MSDPTRTGPAPSILDDAFARSHEVTDLGELDLAWKGTRVHRLEVAGTTTRLLRRDADVGVPADAPTIVGVHGLGGAATNFVEAMAPLASLGNVITLDLPGFGECVPQPGIVPTPQNNATFLADALDALDLGPVVLVGNSMGGMVATMTAATRPDLVSALVLLGPALPGHLPAIRISLVQLQSFGPLLIPILGPWWMRRRYGRMSWRERYLDTIRSIVAEPDAIPERVVAIGTASLAREAELRWRRRSFMAATEALLRSLRPPGTSELLRTMRAVRAPTLYIRGRKDPLVMHATTVQVRRMRLGWTIDEPDGIGHVPQLEAPQWLADRIRDFLTTA